MTNNFTVGSIIKVHNPMQRRYQFQLIEPIGKNFADDFCPYLSPQKMLEMGIFEGRYLNSCRAEYPPEWLLNAVLCDQPDPEANFFKVKSRQALGIWREKGWILDEDPRGWFEWYCRYYLGRRIAGVDTFQIKRWKAFKRHAGQIKANCLPGDLSCRPRQRQALLQWSYDPFI